MPWIGLYYCKKAQWSSLFSISNKNFKRMPNGFIMNLQVTLVHVLSLTMNIFDKSMLSETFT